MVATTLAAAVWFDQQGRRSLVGWSRGVVMVLGIWILGPLFMTIGATFSGGGFAVSGLAPSWMILFIPGVAFLMATYDMSLGALLLITVLLPAVCGGTGPFSRRRRPHD